MTTQANDMPLSKSTPLFQRFRRVAAVLGLCAVVIPATGFWVDANDAQRGIRAVRMRIVHTSPAEPAFSLPARQNFDGPLSLDRARYRAAMRDASGPSNAAGDFIPANSAGRNLVSLHNNQIVLALSDKAYLPLRRISRSKPSQEYRYWTEQGTFLPADGRHRTADPSGTRWLTDANWKLGAECSFLAETLLAEDMQKLLLRMRAPLAIKPHPKSAQYMEFINHSARRFGLSPQLVYAIMRTESAFNPFAVSNAGALGLMQVVPGTAGNEVRTYLTGQSGKPTTSFLFNPESNIEYGCAYLHILATRYFAGVRNQTSRELCMIAAYNAGPGAVQRVFSSTMEDAVNAINQLTPDELFQKLTNRMPAEETRLYVGKVLAAITSYPG